VFLDVVADRAESRGRLEKKCFSPVILTFSFFAAHGGVLTDLLSVDAHLGAVVATSRLHELVGGRVVGAPADRGGPRGPVRTATAA